MWEYETPGIPDIEFERAEGVPITKEEVRAVQICKARLRRGDTIYDIGCGSGSVSVEAALQASRGRVFAVDMNPEAVRLTGANAAKFGTKNITILHGDARGHIAALPMADAVFIGGTGGATAEIIRMCEAKLNAGGRMVIGVILIETLLSVINTLEDAGFAGVDITQITISKSRKTSTGTMMLARNPVTVVSATRDGRV